MQKTIFCLIISAFIFSNINGQSVGLVLSGGGAKGLSHIGVIRALEENNIPIDYIAGTSMGAIIAGLYSIGLTPDEMLILFRSQEFNSWYRGKFEEGYATYVYKRSPNPEMASVALRRTNKNRLSIHIPTSLVSPYPMDLAVMQLFASSAAVAEYDFDKLMIPFRCVAADIANKKPFIMRRGDLGSAVRASMTYPFLFQPIIIDSTLLFDGGFYNNFPWDVVIKDFNPDFLIGSKCSGNSAAPDTDDLISQIENMLMVETDYDIPDEKGLVIDIKFTDVAIMDFHKVNEIVEAGYIAAQKYIEELKNRTTRRVSAEEIQNKRMSFRTKTLPLRYKDVFINGRNLSFSEKEFIEKTIKNDREEPFTFDQLKRGFYRVVATDNINTFYPTATFRPDSLFDLHLRVTKKSPARISIGGNISSSSLNQGFIGFQYNRFSLNPWRANFDLSIGRYYSGLNLEFRQDLGINPLWFYQAEFVMHKYDYFGGNQTELFTNRIPSNIQESEIFTRISVGTPLNLEKNILAKVSVSTGKVYYDYYQTDVFNKDDKPDKSSAIFFSPSLSLERNTTNYKIYPTKGKREKISFRINFFEEKYRSGTTSNYIYYPPQGHTTYQFRSTVDHFFSMTKHLSIGINTDIALSNINELQNYTATLLSLPAYNPNPHSNTLLLKRYRAPSFAALSLTPIFHLSESTSLQFQASYFQPYKLLLESPDNNSPVFSTAFPKGGFITNLAFVWHAPLGPVSISATYYEKSEVKWFPQLNIGFLIFKPKATSH